MERAWQLLAGRGRERGREQKPKRERDWAEALMMQLGRDHTPGFKVFLLALAKLFVMCRNHALCNNALSMGRGAALALRSY